ncbi:MAG TPA: arsenosugar biosynthesis radical SAM (seleno)protein ArsS [Anaerolineales bacterium]|nr:arsenosugar biosynthesis radical SAM (seleno)protein ArsS [Anaerolineales bacterium]
MPTVTSKYGDEEALEALVPSFEDRLGQETASLVRHSLDSLQINVGKQCNQACLHCHVEAGPQRVEIMDQRTAELAIEFACLSGAQTVEITGGAPELNPSFRYMVGQLRQAGLRVIDRSNLTVFFEPGQEELPEFLAGMKVELVASLPCFTEKNVDQQRGRGVYRKSAQALLKLNELGYGKEDSGLDLNLVYNPLGAYLPAPQAELEADYKRELATRFGIRFNHLYTITNIPIGRFAHILARQGEMQAYARLLVESFNPATLDNLMCLRQVSLSWDGLIYDCDFNQMLDMRLSNGRVFRLGKAPAAQIAASLIGKPIRTGAHCYGCTAGFGSSCAGALA